MKNLFLIFLLFLSGCSFHKVQENYMPNVEIKSKFSTDNLFARYEANWFYEFNDRNLNNILEKLFASNLTLKQAWSRLAQSRSNVLIEGAKLYPSIDSSFSLIGQRLKNELGSFTKPNWSDKSSLKANFAWEIDIWGKLESARKSVYFESIANEHDVVNTALLLSGEAVRTYFDIQKNLALKDLLDSQIKTNKEFLDLTNLKKVSGTGSILDIFQQKQQLLAIKAQIPIVERDLKIAKQKLAVLIGDNPVNLNYTVTKQMPSLPVAPNIGTPRSLLYQHPLIRGAFLRLKASDHNIAAKVAEKFPAISLMSTLEFSSRTIGKSLKSSLFTVLGSITQTLFDYNRRNNIAIRAHKEFEEKSHMFTETYLNVLLDIENSLTSEKYLKHKLSYLNEQLVLSKKSVKEAKYQYANGQSDYLIVLTELRNLQNLEQNYIRSKRDLLDSRVALHLASGSSVLIKKDGEIDARGN